MKPRGMDFVCYQVTDMDKSVAFYRDVLGLELLERYEGFWSEFSAPPTTLALYRPENLDANSVGQGGGGFIALAVEDLKSAVEELKGKGVPLVLEMMDTPVCWFSIVADPDGNRIGLHQRKDGTFG